MTKLKIRSSGAVLNHNITCTCGHCNNTIALDVYAEYSHIEEVESTPGKLVKRDILDYSTGQCPYCGKPIIVDRHTKITYPPVAEFEDINHLPKDIEKLYTECKTAYSVGAFTCCVISARTLMANIAVEQGDSIGKTFVDYVNYLQTNCLPTKTNNAWVDKIRKLGNDSTHKLVIASEEDAELSLKFIIAILKNVYEFPNSI